MVFNEMGRGRDVWRLLFGSLWVLFAMLLNLFFAAASIATGPL